MFETGVHTRLNKTIIIINRHGRNTQHLMNTVNARHNMVSRILVVCRDHCVLHRFSAEFLTVMISVVR